MPAGNPDQHRLAYGELDDTDRRELIALKDQIQRDSGFFCGGYKDKCLRRRLAIRMRARGVHRFADYAALLERDPEEYRRLLSVLTINVSKFFRNLEVWEALRREVVPALFRLDVPEVRIWSAGSAGGEEAYTMAILLLEHAAQHGLERRLRRFSVLGTDIDVDILEVARRAEYGDFALSETPPTTRERWFDSGRNHRLRDEVKRLVRFERLDLLTDPLPAECHLIFCRNVTIYFERPTQEQLLHRLRDALVPGGVLVLGKVETLFGDLARSFEVIAGQERIFRKL
jgi:chemotaxis methyl-accepting protein methylase